MNHAPLKIALDGMGGDHAPQAVVAGASLAKVRLPHLFFNIFGDEAQIAPIVKKYKNLADCMTIHHTEDKVQNTDKPSQILRTGKKSSMNLAVASVAEKQSSAVVSSGNTGALMALSMFGLKRLPHVTRPVIASFFPTKKGEACLLDLGGNVEANTRHLLEFAIMGEAFAATALGIARPKVALLNIGEEELKGRDEIIQAASIIKTSNLDIEFVGFLEADGIPTGSADVIVTDGFTGNVVIKTAAGVSRLIKHYLESSIKANLLAKLAYPLYAGALKHLAHHIDPRRYNGAVFLGLGGIAIKSHGSSDEVGFANAIELAHELISKDIMKRTQNNLDILESLKEKI